MSLFRLSFSQRILVPNKHSPAIGFLIRTTVASTHVQKQGVLLYFFTAVSHTQTLHLHTRFHSRLIGREVRRGKRENLPPSPHLHDVESDPPARASPAEMWSEAKDRKRGRMKGPGMKALTQPSDI